jgi:hypothetical protein
MVSLVVAEEKAIHSTSVTFVRARCWSAGGTKAENTMLHETNLSGAGTGGAPGTAHDKERAFLVRFRAGNDSQGRPVYLRKWWHLDVGVLASEAISNDQLRNVTALSTAQRNKIAEYGDRFKEFHPTSLGGGQASLVSDKGRAISGATQAHQYYEHHQLGDMWR